MLACEYSTYSGEIPLASCTWSIRFAVPAMPGTLAPWITNRESARTILTSA